MGSFPRRREVDVSGLSMDGRVWPRSAAGGGLGVVAVTRVLILRAGVVMVGDSETLMSLVLTKVTSLCFDAASLWVMLSLSVDTQG